MISRLFASFLCLALLGTTTAQADNPAPLLGDKFAAAPGLPPAPALEFKDAGGQSRTLHDFHGQFVLLNIWASWCAPCLQELPALDALPAQLGAKLKLVALNEDRNAAITAPAYLHKAQLNNIAVYTDENSQAMWTLHARGLPLTLLIDPAGREIGRVSGEVDWLNPASLAFLQRQLVTRR